MSGEHHSQSGAAYAGTALILDSCAPGRDAIFRTHLSNYSPARRRDDRHARILGADLDAEVLDLRHLAWKSSPDLSFRLVLLGARLFVKVVRCGDVVVALLLVYRERHYIILVQITWALNLPPRQTVAQCLGCCGISLPQSSFLIG